MSKSSLISFICVSILSLASCSNEHTLFSDGKSQYSIVISQNATEAEQFAASELQKSIKVISGAELPVVTAPNGKKGRRIILDSSKSDFKDQSFTYSNKGGDIIIRGGGQRGTMYGTFSFLENELGVRWYTSKVSIYPPKDKWCFTKLYCREKPGLAIRDVFFYDSFDSEWAAHNKSDGGREKSRPTPGGVNQFYGCHTFAHFVPYEIYGKEHPEYFNLMNGKRADGSIPFTIQLCLTNPDVLKLCIESVKQTMREHPEATIVDLSQNDTDGSLKECCECEHCRKIAEQYGGQSGLMLWFVNQVADAVKDEFPDRYVGTFAYRFTRKPPINIVPGDNVIVRLCSIECCFLHGFAECQDKSTREFYEDLQAWSKIAPHLFIWDYVVTFSQYSIPYPNFGALQSNVKSFRDNNAIGVFEQGSYESYGGENAELRAYVLAKLLWNPECDVNAVVNDFLTGYYGPKAGPVIREYFDLEHSLVTDQTHCDIYPNINTPLLTAEFISASDEIFGRALAAVADDNELYNRVEKAYFPVLVLKCARDPKTSQFDGTYELVERIAKRENITVLSEGRSTEYWLENRLKP